MSKVVVVYLSTSGNTKAMADAIVDGANSRNANAKAVNFHEAKIEDIIAADAIAIGSSTFHYRMLPPMEKFIEDLKKANVAGKVGAAFGSYGWSGEAPIMIAEKMRELGMNVIDPVLRIQYQPTEKDLDECKRLGKDIVSKVKKIAEKPRAGSGSKLEDVSVREVKMGEGGH
ncbi:NAD(P)H dehydrogenase (quinone) [Methanosarcinales archaeon]|nr:NAD(P)H dehydrogenase (quinone) [Methanosarcinales archaeon]